MKTVFTLSLLSVCSLTAAAQENGSIELSAIGRYDKHADFVTRYGDRSYTNDMKLWGTSYGLRLNYAHPVAHTWKLLVGAGYYRLNVDKIRSTSPWADNISARTIDYNHPLGIDPLFSTNRYRYNNISITAGVRYELQQSEKLTITASADLTYLYTFSQHYNITYNNIRFRTRNGRPLGIAAALQFGALRKLGNRLYVHPAIVTPVFQQLQRDRVFRENQTEKMTKWFSGAGLSIAVGRYFR